MREIKNVFVDWISLVSKNEAPAVEQAENKFALFKSKENLNKKDLEEIKKNLEKKDLEEIKKNLKCPFLERKH